MLRQRRFRWYRWIPALLWMGVIFYFSHQTGDTLEEYLPLFQIVIPYMTGFDWGHFVSYFILALTLLWGFGPWGLTFKGKAAIVVLCCLYGVTDEFHQRFVSGRHPDLADIRNDTLGALAAMLLVSVPFVRRRCIRWLGRPEPMATNTSPEEKE